MAQQEIKGPSNPSMPFNTGDSEERGDNPKTIVEKINAMMTELYNALASAAFTILPESVSVDRPFVLKGYTVAELPASIAGGLVYVSDGAAGSPIMAFGDGTDWLRCDTGAAVAAA